MDNERSRYFTLVIYPDEAPKRTVQKLSKLGILFISPIHDTWHKPVGYIGEFAPSEFKATKQHQHLLLKMPNKQTENSFIIKLSEALNNDFTGVALHKGDALVKDVTMMIRYFYHMDSPNKEPFDWQDALMDVSPQFTEEVLKAFNLEITVLISMKIQTEEIKNIQQIMIFFPNQAVLTKWLYTGKNMYVVNSMFNEIRRNSKI